MSKKKNYTAQFIGDVESYDKNKPFVIGSPETYNAGLFKYSYKRAGLERIKLFGGKRLDADPCPQHVIYSTVPEETVKIFDVLPVRTFPIFNKRAVGVLEKICPDDFQAFPIKIINSPDKKKLEPFENNDYFIINITNTVDALDKENSNLKCYEDGSLYGVENLVLKSDVMGGHHLSRDETLHSKKLVSYELALELIKQKITGIAFEIDIAY
ncbi:MAG: hypothetical protein COB50_05140 [Thiotrichales bacterium]|nr:MAG: hypothetical protein COB50_05140 [Thiotrichales bacterium]